MTKPTQSPFAILPWEIAADTRLSARDLRVLIALLSFRRRDTGPFWATREQISERCGISANHVSDVTRRLEILGWLTKEGKGRTTTRYHFVVPESVDSTVPTPGPSQAGDRPNQPSQAGDRCEPQPSQRGDSTVPAPGHSESHSDIQEQDQKQKQPPAQKPPAAREPMPDVPDWIDSNAWRGFAEMRRRQRFPMTPRAAALVIRKLESLREHGHDPTAVLDQSTRNAWRDVYPIKPDQSDAAHGISKPSLVQRAEADLRDYRARNGT